MILANKRRIIEKYVEEILNVAKNINFKIDYKGVVFKKNKMERFYPDELIEEIRIRNDIINVVSE